VQLADGLGRLLAGGDLVEAAELRRLLCQVASQVAGQGDRRTGLACPRLALEQEGRRIGFGYEGPKGPDDLALAPQGA